MMDANATGSYWVLDSLMTALDDAGVEYGMDLEQDTDGPHTATFQCWMYVTWTSKAGYPVTRHCLLDFMSYNPISREFLWGISESEADGIVAELIEAGYDI